MGEVRGSIQRVDDPLYRRAGLCRAGFLRQYRMRRVSAENAANDQFLALLVCNGDKVRVTFELDKLFAAGIVVQDVSGGPAEVDRRFEIVH